MAIPYGRQEITEADIEAVARVLRSDYLTQGPEVALFENEFANYVGAPHAVAVTNGTAALHLSCLALGVGPGTRVITTPLTFAASANCVLYCGGEIDFADIDPRTYCLDPKAVEALIESHPKGTFQGIIPVDFAGYPCDLEAFRKVADKHGLWILHDACHSPGAFFEDSQGQAHRSGDGSLAELTVFSFHPVKHIAAGEGGMVTSANPALMEKIALLRTHGITKDPGRLVENHGPWYYEMQELGFNYRLTDIQSALGRSQLKRADSGLQRRRELAEQYDELLAGLPVETPYRAIKSHHAFHLYVVKTPQRAELFEALRKAEIFAQVHYIPVHCQPYHYRRKDVRGSLPEVESLYPQILSLPMYPSLSDADQKRVVEKMAEFWERPKAGSWASPDCPIAP